jgi:phage-related protein
MPSGDVRKPVHFVASSLKDLQALPAVVRGSFGRLLLDTQYGETPYGAKPLKGFGGAGVLELIENYDTNTYRAIYTVRLAGAVYVLHVFQKKSRKGIATPKSDLDLVRLRYEMARQHHVSHYTVAPGLEDK